MRQILLLLLLSKILGGDAQAAEQSTVLRVGDQFLCLIEGAGAAQCLGEQLPALYPKETPANEFRKLPSKHHVDDLSPNNSRFCVLDDQANLHCSGSAKFSVDKVALLRTGKNHSCYLDQSGQIGCWGDNTYGQIGDGTLEKRSQPILIKLSAPATDIALGANHTCALTKEGTILCWGSNYGGQLGLLLKSRFPVPQQGIKLRAKPNKLLGSYDGDFTCALYEQSVECWGSVREKNGACMKKLPSSYLLPQGETASSFVATARSIYGLRKDGRASMWIPDVHCKKPIAPGLHQPIAVPGMAGGVLQFDASSHRICSLMDDRQVKCYGLPPGETKGLAKSYALTPPEVTKAAK